MPFDLLIAGSALVYAAMNFLKYLRAQDWSAVVTQAGSWVVGIAVVSLMAHSDFAAGVKIGGRPLDRLDGSTLVLLGVSFIGSIASAGYDLKRAVDGNDSARTPPLIPGTGDATVIKGVRTTTTVVNSGGTGNPTTTTFTSGGGGGSGRIVEGERSRPGGGSGTVGGHSTGGNE